jgi:hypothetical protein
MGEVKSKEDSLCYIPMSTEKEFDEAEKSFENQEGKYYQILGDSNGVKSIGYATEHFLSELIEPAPDLQLDERSCPCKYGEPCKPNCSCANNLSSAGCSCCCAYGSEEQREYMAAHLKARRDMVQDLSNQLSEGRSYLMSVDADKITVEDALEAFGFGRNGLRS